MGLHFILQHLDKPGTYARILFVDFSLAFNTIIPSLLQTKQTQFSVPISICQRINSFLTDRQQLVRLGKFMSNSHTTSTGAPQGCVLSLYCSSPCTPMTILARFIYLFSHLADAFVQRDLQMRAIETIKTNKRATTCKCYDKSWLA